jgi:hypothetical protein
MTPPLAAPLCHRGVARVYLISLALSVIHSHARSAAP